MCSNGEKILGCVTFSFDGKERTIEVEGGKELTAGDLNNYGKPGRRGEGVGARGFIKGCSDPGNLWKKAVKEWEGRIR